MVIDPTGAKAHVKFGYSRSNSSRDIRLPHFVMTDYDDASRRTLCPLSKTPYGVLPKNRRAVAGFYNQHYSVSRRLSPVRRRFTFAAP